MLVIELLKLMLENWPVTLAAGMYVWITGNC